MAFVILDRLSPVSSSVRTGGKAWISGVVILDRLSPVSSADDEAAPYEHWPSRSPGMNRDLYLYEVVDVIGQGQYDYMEHLWQDPVLRMPEMFGLQGAFYILGAGGGRWPQVINIWDIGSEGWKGLAKNLDWLNLKRRKAFYGTWWDEAA